MIMKERVIKSINVAHIKMDRYPLNKRTTGLINYLLAGGGIPPIKVARLSQGGYLIRDGRHRVTAYKMLGIEKIEAKFSTIPLKDLSVRRKNGKKVTLQSILKDTSRRSRSFSVNEIKSKSRGREIVKYRFFYFKRARLELKESYSKIGKMVNKDHATVMHGIEKVDTERLQHGTLLDEYYKFWEDKPKELVSEVVSKKICEPPPERIVRHEYETSGFMAFNGYKPHQI